MSSHRDMPGMATLPVWTAVDEPHPRSPTTAEVADPPDLPRLPALSLWERLREPGISEMNWALLTLALFVAGALWLVLRKR
jgi:hypothetical protein